MPRTKPQTSRYLHLLTEALESPLGKEITTNDPNRLRQRLYILRGEQAPLFDSLSFAVGPEPNTLWIVKRKSHEDH